MGERRKEDMVEQVEEKKTREGMKKMKSKTKERKKFSK